MERTDWWPQTAPPPAPPALPAALEKPLRAFAGCWLDLRCGCGSSFMPIRLLLTEGRHRAELPLRRAVKAFERCTHCGQANAMALVSNPLWQDRLRTGGPPNWSLMLNGPEAGTVAVTKTRRQPGNR